MKELLDDFQQTIESASVKLLRIPEDLSAIPREKGKWSPKQIIGHLIDSAANNHRRFVTAQFSDDLVFPGYDQEGWVSVQRYNEEPWLQLVQLWKTYNLHLLHFISFMPEAALTKLRTKHSLNQIAWRIVDENESVTLAYLIQDYVAHLKNHLRQILPAL